MIRDNRRFPFALRPLVPVLLCVMMLAGLLAGCGDDAVTAPDRDGDPAQQAPTLPDAGLLSIDLGFFDAATEDKIGRQNFFNAYLRAVIVTATTQLVLAPPVGAFALAVHTFPSLQPDGSWIWVYTHVRGSHEVQIRLRAEFLEEGAVAWAMRVFVPAAGIENRLWFDGITQDEGRQGQWTFYDIDVADGPVTGAVSWANDDPDHQLQLTVLHGPHAGDVLTFSVSGDQHRIDYQDADPDTVWFIRWNASDNTGSLQVPGYRGGVESCWDEELFDVDCDA